MFTVKTYSTRGKRVVETQTNAEVWKELVADLTKNGVDVDGMKAIVMENQVTLESPDAVLPKGLTINGTVTQGFTLFLTPVKTKSGVDVDDMGYHDLKAFIKEAREQNPEVAVPHFGNYTQKSTTTMRELVKSYLASSATTACEDCGCKGFDFEELTVVEKLTLAKDWIDDAINGLTAKADDPKEVVKSEEEVLGEIWNSIKKNFTDLA